MVIPALFLEEAVGADKHDKKQMSLSEYRRKFLYAAASLYFFSKISIYELINYLFEFLHIMATDFLCDS